MTCRREVSGLVPDRDLSATIKPRDTAVSSTVAACGDTSGGGIPTARESTSHVSLKQEAKVDE